MAARKTTGFDRDLRWLRVGDLEVDPDYQRDLYEGHRDKIKADFDELRLAPIVVSERPDGSKFVTEGQHRVTAARELFGDQYHVPALVFRNLSKAEEARSWGGNRLSKGTRGHEEHKSAVVEGDDLAVKVQSILDVHGLRVGASSAGDTISASRELTRLVDKYGTEPVNDSLALLHRAFGYDRSAWTAPMLRGMTEFLVDFPTADHERILRIVLTERTAKEFEEAAVAWAKNKSLAEGAALMAKYRAVSLYVLHRYNLKLKTNRLSKGGVR